MLQILKAYIKVFIEKVLDELRRLFTPLYIAHYKDKGIKVPDVLILILVVWYNLLDIFIHVLESEYWFVAV
jgi:hypothetical protein